MRYIIAVGKLVLKQIKPDNTNNNIKEENNDELVETDNELIININNNNIDNLNRADTMQTILMESDSVKIHDLSPTLWHAIDLYICIFEKNITGFINDAALSLIECSLRMSEEHW